MKIVSIYKLKDRLLIHPDSRTTAGVWIAAEPFLPLPLNSSSSDVGSAVSVALEGSLDRAPHPTDWRATAAPRLSAAGVRSERSFQMGTALVTVTQSEDGYIVEPHLNGGASGDNKGFHPIPELQRSISHDSNHAAIGSAVIDSLEACR